MSQARVNILKRALAQAEKKGDLKKVDLIREKILNEPREKVETYEQSIASQVR